MVVVTATTIYIIKSIYNPQTSLIMSYKFKKNRFMNVVFCIRNDQKNKNGTALLYWYLSFNGQRSKKYSSGIRVNTNDWEKSHATGINAKPINDAIGDIKADLTYIFNNYKDTLVNIQEVADIYLNKQDGSTVLELYDNLVIRKTSENWSEGTVKTYKSFRKQWLSPYLDSVSKPFYANKFRPKHIEELATKMRTECGEDFIRKSLSKVKAAFNLGFALEKINTNPISSYRLFYSEKKHKDYVYLTPTEIEELAKLTFSDKETHLEVARDLFLLQCYTSLSFNELKDFDVKEHYQDSDNWKWILQKRGKTDILQQIPLLPQAIKLLQKLKFDTTPTSNHRYNEYIRICAYRANIDKHLHSHLGRISCGAYLLNMGISIEVVSRVLGYTNTKQTEKVYAKVQDNWRVKNEFDKIFRSQEVEEPKEKHESIKPLSTKSINFTYSYSK